MSTIPLPLTSLTFPSWPTPHLIILQVLLAILFHGQFVGQRWPSMLIHIGKVVICMWGLSVHTVTHQIKGFQNDFRGPTAQERLNNLHVAQALDLAPYSYRMQQLGVMLHFLILGALRLLYGEPNNATVGNYSIQDSPYLYPLTGVCQRSMHNQMSGIIEFSPTHQWSSQTLPWIHRLQSYWRWSEGTNCQVEWHYVTVRSTVELQGTQHTMLSTTMCKIYLQCIYLYTLCKYKTIMQVQHSYPQHPHLLLRCSA